ncbi:DUF4345 domain-containing protein [Arthrobacter sp. zg-Y750]|uniref:DUF4345 domain-containing protein n=1 Tax=Arthrobacter sp. zg-Y750 TaxID=2894189 RepID=UPI001E4E0655|nr:DUF4345 domain-containing protein [Arthrobacter sp. zg-Y750]MCC9178843.1 DUF4345 domain-containing protein [Arthrobacter sp. zg-Y750]
MSNTAPAPGEGNRRAGSDIPGTRPPQAAAAQAPGTGDGRRVPEQAVPGSGAKPRRGSKGSGAPKPRKAPKAYKASDDWAVFRAVVIGVGILVAGFGLYNLITGTAGLPDGSGGEVNATLESQYRFFSAMMVGVGAAFVAIAVKFQWANMLWLVCLMVFLGGIGRVVSWAFSGTPHFTFIVLMIVELAFPPALLVWHRFIAKTSELRQEYSQQGGAGGGAADPGIAGGAR